ncbi:hypothetical protein KQE47_26400, partial [Raoultella planticola]|uniref:hypothetical protein n=1 Tax=Raoultella planticola TaxID=575 RepID=UPI0024807926
MNRRTLLSLGLSVGPLALLYANGATAAETTTAAAPPSHGGGRLLFPDDAQFWFETVRSFGAAEYGGSLFGE